MTDNLHQRLNPQTTMTELWSMRDSVCVIDVRSPKEYAEGAIPSAVSLPLLSDAERSRVGLLYKEFGQQKAVDEGYNIFEPKLQDFISYFQQFSKHIPLVVYCARGGMRSQVITAFARAQGFKAKQLTGGYKAFRNYNLERLGTPSQFSSLVILHGKTGVGKTIVLNQLQNSLDLEGLAQHRGSLFGGIGKHPVTQKEFEARLMLRIEALDQSRATFVEGESRKIGNLVIPPAIFSSMKSGRVVLLEASIETRVRRTVDEYINQNPANVAEIRSIIGFLEKDLGKKNVKRLQEELDHGEYEKCFEFILLHYYDKKYTYSMKNLDVEFAISTEDVTKAVNQLINLI